MTKFSSFSILILALVFLTLPESYCQEFQKKVPYPFYIFVGIIAHGKHWVVMPDSQNVGYIYYLSSSEAGRLKLQIQRCFKPKCGKIEKIGAIELPSNGFKLEVTFGDYTAVYSISREDETKNDIKINTINAIEPVKIKTLGEVPVKDLIYIQLIGDIQLTGKRTKILHDIVTKIDGRGDITEIEPGSYFWNQRVSEIAEPIFLKLDDRKLKDRNFPSYRTRYGAVLFIEPNDSDQIEQLMEDVRRILRRKGFIEKVHYLIGTTGDTW